MNAPSYQDDIALLSACRAGDFDAGARFVARHQWELVRVAYLLSGDQEQATRLATMTLVATLIDPPPDETYPRHYLLLHLARTYVESSPPSTWLTPENGDRHAVEDESYRVKVALERLNPHERAALILTCYAGLPGDLLQGLSGSSSQTSLTGTAMRASERVALAAGRSRDANIAGLLNRLLIDAPSTDLWPEIQDPVRAGWSKHRRRQRTLTAAFATSVGLLIVVAAIWLAGPRIRSNEAASPISTGADTATTLDVNDSPVVPEPRAAFASAPTLELFAANTVSVPDMQLVRMIEQAGEGRSAVYSYDPAANETTPLIDTGSSVEISPDGRWIIAQRNLLDASGMSVLAASQAADRQVSWEASVPEPKAIAIGDDSIYVLSQHNAESFQIQIIALETGEVTGSWPVGSHALTPSTIRAVRVDLSPDGERLALLAERVDPNRPAAVRTLTVYAVDDGTVIDAYLQTVEGSQGSRDFSVSSARPVPGEHSIYSAVPAEHDQQLRLQFLDLDQGTLSSLTLPLSPRTVAVESQRGENEIHLIPSNSGRLLYVVQSRQRQVAVVDLGGRQVIGIFPLVASGDEQPALESTLNRVSYLEALLSPDGTRLYLATNREKNQAVNGYPSQAPIWVFDTTSWQVVDRWTVSGMPRAMTMNGDGSIVYLRSARSDGVVLLTMFDAATGEALEVRDEIPRPAWADVQRILSMAGVYHDMYGIRPAIGDIIPRDNPIVSVLPGVAIEAQKVVAGTEAVVTARVVHPVTGAPASSDPTLRFDPDATLAIELSRAGNRAILIPSKVEPGVYQGRTQMDAAGAWDARVTVINQDGTTWVVNQPDAITVSEGLVASNGGAYRFLVRPANPVNRRTITLRVWMVQSQSGERLPEEIEFLDAIADNAQIILTHPSGERIEEPLTRVDHASFIGWARFGTAGTWDARIILDLISGERLSINAGPVEITDLTEPYRRSGPGAGAASANAGNRMAHPASR